MQNINDIKMNVTELQKQTAGLFNGKLPVNHPLVQMIINDKIAQRELLEAQANWREQPKRKAYFYEKLTNLTNKVLHYIKARKQDKHNSTITQALLLMQKDLLVLTNARPDWTTSFIETNVLILLLNEY